MWENIETTVATILLAGMGLAVMFTMVLGAVSLTMIEHMSFKHAIETWKKYGRTGLIDHSQRSSPMARL